VSTQDSTSNSERDIFCRLTRNRYVGRRGLFAAFEPAESIRRGDAIGSRSLPSRQHTHYVARSVVQSEIHHPTDNTLLADAVRVLTRVVKRVGETVPRAVCWFHNRNRSAKRRSQEIQRMTSRERQTRQTRKYRELIEITQEVVQSARVVLNKSQNATVPDVLEAAKLQGLRQEIEHYCQLGGK